MRPLWNSFSCLGAHALTITLLTALASLGTWCFTRKVNPAPSSTSRRPQMKLPRCSLLAVDSLSAESERAERTEALGFATQGNPAPSPRLSSGLYFLAQPSRCESSGWTSFFRLWEPLPRRMWVQPPSQAAVTLPVGARLLRPTSPTPEPRSYFRCQKTTLTDCQHQGQLSGSEFTDRKKEGLSLPTVCALNCQRQNCPEARGSAVASTPGDGVPGVVLVPG